MYKDFGKITTKMNPPMRHTYHTPRSALPWLYLPWVILAVLLLLGFILG